MLTLESYRAEMAKNKAEREKKAKEKKKLREKKRAKGICFAFQKSGKCEKGKDCSFAHSQKENPPTYGGNGQEPR